MRRVKEVFNQLDIQDLAEKRILEMSLGQVKRVLLARALVREPRLLVLDEPCEGLDPASRGLLLELLQFVTQQGTQVLYSCHRRQELLPNINHVLLLDKGLYMRPRTAGAGAALP